MLLKKALWMTFAIGLLAAGSAFASDHDDVRFECHFRCGCSEKPNNDEQKCEAKGQLDQRKLRDDNWVLGDKDDFLRIRCDDDRGDKINGEDRDGILYGRHGEDLFITGDKTTDPLIIVEDARKLEGRHEAKIIFHEREKTGDMKGECEFRKKDEKDPNSISPGPLL